MYKERSIIFVNAKIGKQSGRLSSTKGRQRSRVSGRGPWQEVSPSRPVWENTPFCLTGLNRRRKIEPKSAVSDDKNKAQQDPTTKTKLRTKIYRIPPKNLLSSRHNISRILHQNESLDHHDPHNFSKKNLSLRSGTSKLPQYGEISKFKIRRLHDKKI